MLIGIDASRAFIKNRTGIEEYSYQTIKHLIPILKTDQVVLYIKRHQLSVISHQNFELPSNWKFKIINFPYLWTQVGLSWELLFHPVDVLFIPAHVVPLWHPKNTIVTIHGLEYEFCPKAYPFWARLYMRWAIKRSCRVAKKVIAVSENTKQDLMKLYNVPEEKISVIYEGYCKKSEIQNPKSEINSKFKIPDSKFILFIGRLEERKNILGILEAYEILKEKYNIPHSLVLAGKPGYNYEIIKLKIDNLLKINNCPSAGEAGKLKIIELGFINEPTKWQLLSQAELFLFPTFYEGFGLPILEAQSVGVPVVASNNSSIHEVASNSALLVNPKNPSEIAEAANKMIIDEKLRNDLIERGYENVKRFCWEKCAQDIAEILK